MTAEDFDRFRATYRDMTFAEKSAFYRQMAKDHPQQEHYSSPGIMRFFMSVPDGASVTELGGWDGQMASEVLVSYPKIRSWTNWEIAPVPQFCYDRRYAQPAMAGEIWDMPEIEGGVFVASHSIEHNSDEEIERIIKKLEAKFVYIDTPLTEGRISWDGSTSTHVMNMGWSDLSALLAECGFREFMRCGDQIRGFSR